jgi:hypothetical protein
MLGPSVEINLSGLSGSQEHQTVVGTEMVGCCPMAPIRHRLAFRHTGEDGEGDDAFWSLCMKPILYGESFCF